MSKVAFVGLGAMGSRMAANLLKAGHGVTVCDLAPDAVKKLTDSGARAAADAREAAEGNDFVLAMVRDDEISCKVWLDATSGALAGMKRGAITIECSTITPAWARELGDAISKTGIAMLEAPVSGSTPQAQNAQLIFSSVPTRRHCSMRNPCSRPWVPAFNMRALWVPEPWRS